MPGVRVRANAGLHLHANICTASVHGCVCSCPCVCGHVHCVDALVLACAAPASHPASEILVFCACEPLTIKEFLHVTSRLPKQTKLKPHSAGSGDLWREDGKMTRSLDANSAVCRCSNICAIHPKSQRSRKVTSRAICCEYVPEAITVETKPGHTGPQTHENVHWRF